MRARVAGGLLGVVFGFVLCWSGMSDPSVIREALLFEDAYLFLMFASAVAVAAAGLRLLRRRRPWAPERPARRHVLGSLLFGVGWAVSGACPGPVAAQIGQGVPWAVFTLAGVLVGVHLFLRHGAEESEPACDASPVRYGTTPGRPRWGRA